MEDLTKKQQGFVKDYVATDNGTLAALNNYDIQSDDPENVAAAIASENLTKPKIQRAIAEMIPDELLGEKHLALLNKLDDKGEIDVQAVSKGLDMGYKIKGVYAPDKSINLNVEANITDPKARELAQRYEDELRNTL